ncbi:MAG: DUF2339 domain-containing protein, partial [Gemmatimonadetes bacterium]|nr:DUF2339 domain-containing protein [Gemmatimonadota bacterium]
MWFVGLIVGGFIGAIGDIGGAFVGAIVGAVIGAVISSQRKQASDERLKGIEGEIKQLQRRVEALEGGEIPAAAAPGTAAAPGGEPVTEAPTSAAAVGQAALVPVAAPAMSHPEVAAGYEMAGATQAPAPPIAEEPSAAAPAQAARRAPAGPPPASADDVVSRWLFGGNTLVRVGIVVLFIGVAFLLKYAAERDLLPVELRLAAVALGGIALLVVGWRLRLRRPGYGLILQGGGVGILYLTVFAALRLYKMLPTEAAFALLAGIAVFSAMLAVLQDSRSLAITGAVGGFLAPVLASTGGGNHVALFSFYAVLNGGILGIAYYKAWRELNLVGFAFTFVIGFLWGSKYYQPALFSSTEPFVVLFFVFYVAIAVLFALRQAPQLTHYVDGTLVFGTPLLGFGMQAALVRDMEFGAAWSAFDLSAFYLVLATALYARKRDSLRLLVESFLALGVGFATLAVPLAFDGRWTSAVWAVEGAAVLWAGVRQGQILPRVFGILLQFAAGIAFVTGVEKPAVAMPVLNSLYLGCVMVSVAGLFCSYYLDR